MNKAVFSIFVMCICIFLFGCSKQIDEQDKKEVNKTEDVVKLVNEFTGYSAKTKVTYYFNDNDIENKTIKENKTINENQITKENKTTVQNTFEMSQDGVIDGRYKIVLTAPEGLVGNTTIFDGNSIYHFNSKRSNQTYVSASEYPERVEILLTSFIDNYKNKTSEYSKIGELTSGQYIVLEGVIDGSNTYFAKEQLILDSATYKPLKLNIYTSSGEKFVEVEYLEFTYNPNFDEAYFTHSKN